jgi:hypothetical protein
VKNGDGNTWKTSTIAEDSAENQSTHRHHHHRSPDA